MLQFIVLGIVPGTSIQLTFTDILLCGLIVVAIPALWFYSLEHRTRKQAQHIATIQLISL